MILDICRIIKKGKGDTLVNLKIKEFHKQEFDQKNKETLLKYKKLQEDLQENLTQSDIDNFIQKKEEMELKDPWLNFNELEEIAMPEFELSEEVLNKFRRKNYIKFRIAFYASKSQLDMIYEDKINNTNKHETFCNLVRNRFPKTLDL